MDRYVRVYRKDTPPSEDELAARRQGDPWNLQIQQQIDENVSKFLVLLLQKYNKLIFIFYCSV